MHYLSPYKDGRLLLRVTVQPKSSRNCVVGIHRDTVKLAVTAPPVDGKANKAVITYLATLFKLRKKDITVKHGLQSRVKSILLAEIELHSAEKRLQEYL